MSPRSIRRAAERKAQKEARKVERFTTEPCTSASVSDELDWRAEPDYQPFLAARQRVSTGPRTEEGKRIASMNAGDEVAVLSVPKTQALTGLTGRTVLLPSDDADAYRDLIAAYQREHQPAGLRETELVQSMADTQWRLQRIPALESAIYSKGRHEFAEAHAEQEITLRKALIDLDTHLKYEKQLRNLQLQESRLHRRYEKEAAELRQLQTERKTNEAKTRGAKPSAVEAPTREFVFSNGAGTSPVPSCSVAFSPHHEAA